MTGKVFYGLAAVTLAIVLGGCAPTVSAEGYVSETPFERYMRNMPVSYTGQRPALLKPPSQSETGPTYQYIPATPAAPMAPAPVVTSHSLAPPSYIQPPAPASTDAWRQMNDYDGTLPTVTPPATAGRIQLTPPPARTREVDYGNSITIYPLDVQDAAMPYIPPAYRPPVPAITSTRHVPAGYNQ